VAPEPPLPGSVVRSYNLRDSTWIHALLLVLTYSLYAGYPVFRVPIMTLNTSGTTSSTVVDAPQVKKYDIRFILFLSNLVSYNLMPA
jgi:hypothetical protein